MKTLKIPCFSSFILKILALLTMTFDHIGVVLMIFFPENHIVIDFDIPDETGNKCFEKNLEEAEKMIRR